jgi:Ser-tRNA(Ala) deacylase AlaX
MKVLSAGWNAFNETGKYTYATVEYAGLASYSVLKSGGTVVNDGIQKIIPPVASAICWPFAVIKDKASVIFRSKKHEEKIKSLTEKLAEVEERLAKIEKYGLIPVSEAVAMKKGRKLAEDKQLVLKEILEETISLKKRSKRP